MKSFIVFLGVDGSGKSTLIQEIKNEIENCTVFHFSPSHRYNTATVIKNPHNKNNYSITLSLIKFIFLIVNSIYSYLFFIKNGKNNKLIIGDRYFYDIAIDPRRYRLNLPSFITNLIYFLVPKPDMIFVLMGDPYEIILRKKEVSLNEIIRQQLELEGIARAKNNWILLDSTKKAVSDLLTQILEMIK
jgi:thymidylate kinase